VPSASQALHSWRVERVVGRHFQREPKHSACVEARVEGDPHAQLVQVLVPEGELDGRGDARHVKALGRELVILIKKYILDANENNEGRGNQAKCARSCEGKRKLFGTGTNDGRDSN